MKNLIINIPFQGFYESIWNDGLDRVEDYLVDALKDEHPDANNIADLIWHCAAYRKAYLYTAEKYVTYLNDYIKDEFGLDLDLKFESLQSPKYYNYETDRIFCYISEENVRKLRTLVPEDELRLAIKTRFTSRSGFISSYPNCLEDWNPDPTTWDHNELGTLLVALLGEGGDWEWDILEGMTERNVFDRAFEECVDWKKFDELVKEAA